MELILALILIAVVGTRVAADKAAIRKSDIETKKWIAEHKVRLDAWLERVSDRDLEYSITRQSEQRYTNAEVKNELLTALDEMKALAKEYLPTVDEVNDTIMQLVYKNLEVAKDIKTFLKLSKFCSVDKLAVQIMMANRGKLRYQDANDGIACSCDCYSELYEVRMADFYTNMVFIKWLDKKLQEHGIHEQLYEQRSGSQMCKEFDDKPWGGAIGAFLWEPSVTNMMLET